MRKALYILGQLSDDDVEWMITSGKQRRVSAGSVLIHEGRPIDELYIVLDGELYVSVAGVGEVARLGAGEIVGEMSLVDARPPSATVMAHGDSVVFALQRSQVNTKLEQDAAFAARFYRAIAVFLSERLRNTVSRLGYGGDHGLDEDVDYQDELDPNLLDNVHLAGARFDRLLKRLMVR